MEKELLIQFVKWLRIEYKIEEVYEMYADEFLQNRSKEKFEFDANAKEKLGKTMSRNFTLVPEDQTYCNNKIYNDLSKIKGVKIRMIKGMIFINTESDDIKEEVQKYLDDNKDLFEYAID